MDNEQNKIWRKRRGQALALQWVIAILERLISDINFNNSTVTKELLSGFNSVNGDNELNALEIGCQYSIIFLKPFAIELGLKSLLLKEGVPPPNKHNLDDLYSLLSTSKQNHLDAIYRTYINDNNHKQDIRNLFSSTADRFVDCRYLDDVSKVQKVDGDLHAALSSILDLLNS